MQYVGFMVLVQILEPFFFGYLLCMEEKEIEEGEREEGGERKG